MTAIGDLSPKIHQIGNLNIASALNRKYLLYAGVMLTSVCVNNPFHVDAYLLHSELTEEDFLFLNNALSSYDISIHSVTVDKQIFSEDLPTTALWSQEMYYHLILPELISEKIDRILYLDVDIIVNHSLEDLYNTPFNGCEIVATIDYNGRLTIADMTEKQQIMFRPMLEKGFRYFNSGVMLLNLDALRGKYSIQFYMELAKEWDYNMSAPDQDLINYAHLGRVIYVDDLKYNLFARNAFLANLSYDEVKKQATIVHFTGEKPWGADGFHFKVEQLWWDYAALTPFYSSLLEDFQKEQMNNLSISDKMRRLEEENLELKQKLLAVLAKFVNLPTN